MNAPPPKNVPPKNVAPTITTWITMGFALVALILGIVALTVQPKSIQAGTGYVEAQDDANHPGEA